MFWEVSVAFSLFVPSLSCLVLSCLGKKCRFHTVFIRKVVVFQFRARRLHRQRRQDQRRRAQAAIYTSTRIDLLLSALSLCMFVPSLSC
eukprot:COSAG06_NODE_1535_length_9155_cov_68.266343_10_plen_89_part_00